MELDIPGILERCSEPGGAYLPLRRRGLDALVQREWQSRGHDPMETAKRLDDSSAHIFKNRKKIRAGLVDDVFVKRYNYRGLWTAFRRSFKLPRPMRVLAGAIRLKEYEIPTPEVLITARRTKFRLPYEDFLVTRELSTLQLPLDKLAGEFAQGDPYRQFVSGVTALMVKMHAAGVEHGDLRRVGHDLLAGTDAHQVGRVVERAEGDALPDGLLAGLGDDAALDELVAAVPPRAPKKRGRKKKSELPAQPPKAEE